MTAYPSAEIVPLHDVALWSEEEEYDFILGGMGVTSTKVMMSNRTTTPWTSRMANNPSAGESTRIRGSGGKTSSSSDPGNYMDVITVDRDGMALNSSVPGIESLYYLANLALSGQDSRKSSSSSPLRHNNPIRSPEMKNERQLAYIGQLANIAQNRFASHTPESIRRNYNAVMDLLTRCRKRPSLSSSVEGGGEGRASSGTNGNLMFEMTRAGLSLTEAEARGLIAEFPQICLYETHELVQRIRFMISPLSPTMENNDQNWNSRESTNVDCELYNDRY